MVVKFWKLVLFCLWIWGIVVFNPPQIRRRLGGTLPAKSTFRSLCLHACPSFVKKFELYTGFLVFVWRTELPCLVSGNWKCWAPQEPRRTTLPQRAPQAHVPSKHARPVSLHLSLTRIVVRVPAASVPTHQSVFVFRPSVLSCNTTPVFRLTGCAWLKILCYPTILLSFSLTTLATNHVIT